MGFLQNADRNNDGSFGPFWKELVEIFKDDYKVEVIFEERKTQLLKRGTHESQSIKGPVHDDPAHRGTGKTRLPSDAPDVSVSKGGFKMNTFVDFLGDFEKPDPNVKNPGGDLTDFLTEGLKERGFEILEVQDGEFAFFMKVLSGKIKYEIMVSLDSLYNERWEVSCPPKLDFISRLLGRKENEELGSLLKAIDEILKSNPKIKDIRWFPDYDDPVKNKKRKFYYDPFQRA